MQCDAIAAYAFKHVTCKIRDVRYILTEAYFIGNTLDSWRMSEKR